MKSWARERAIDVIESGDYPPEETHSHTFTIEDVEMTMRIRSGEADEEATPITVVPE